jgi:uncharacterized protein (TIGR02453 family)
MSFEGFGPSALEWFSELERDNTRAFFTATRDRYETEVRGQLEAMLDELTGEFGGTVKVFRQQRDIRFSPDRSPYKLRTYGVLLGARQGGNGLYAEVSAHGLYAGTGYHQMARDQLDRYRAAVADDATGPGLETALATAVDAGLELAGQSLRTAPRGYDRDHARIDLLRRKALIAGLRLHPGADGIPRDAALEHVSACWRAAAPLNGWLDANVGPTTLEEVRRR